MTNQSPLRKLRKERKMSQHKLADALGIAQSVVSKIERGNQAPGIKVFYGLLKMKVSKGRVLKLIEYYGALENE